MTNNDATTIKPSPLRRFGARARRALAAIAADIAKWALRWLVISAILVGAAFLALPGPKPLQQNTTLYVGLDRPIAESSPLDAAPYLQFLLNPPKLSAAMIERYIRIAADDSRIARLSFRLTIWRERGRDRRPASPTRSTRRARRERPSPSTPRILKTRPGRFER